MPSRMPFIVSDGSKLLYCKCNGKDKFVVSPRKPNLNLPDMEFMACPWRIAFKDMVSDEEKIIETGITGQKIEMRPTCYKEDSIWNILFIEIRDDPLFGFMPNLYRISTSDWKSFSSPRRVLAKNTKKGLSNSKYIVCDGPGNKNFFAINKKNGKRYDISTNINIDSLSYFSENEDNMILNGSLEKENKSYIINIETGDVKLVKNKEEIVRDFSFMGNLFFFTTGKDESKMEIKNGEISVSEDPNITITIRRN